MHFLNTLFAGVLLGNLADLLPDIESEI